MKNKDQNDTQKKSKWKTWHKIVLGIAIVLIAVSLFAPKKQGEQKEAMPKETSQTETTQRVSQFDADGKSKENFEQGSVLSDEEYIELSKYYLNDINDKLKKVSAFGELTSKNSSSKMFEYIDIDNRNLIACADYEDGENSVLIDLEIPSKLENKNGDKATAAILEYFGYTGNLKEVFEKISASSGVGKIVSLDLDETLSLMYGFPSDNNKKVTINIVKTYSK
ncbi:hypothetical protein ACQRB4_02240 [Peptoniphilaceae bacterium SGI.097]